MEKAFYLQFDLQTTTDDTWHWSGGLKSPHWGSLACMAFAYAYRETNEKKYLNAALSYNKYLVRNMADFSTSEYAYILIGASACAVFMDRKEFKGMAYDAAGNASVGFLSNSRSWLSHGFVFSDFLRDEQM